MRLIETEIRINRSANEIFDYVTRPSRWHQWYPSSIESDTQDRPQVKGDKFSVPTVQKPFRHLPFIVKKAIHYEVIECQPASAWRIAAHSPSIDTDTRYQLVEDQDGTLFKRSFHYQTKGLLRILEPITFRRGLVKDSEVAIKNLKVVMEQSA